MNKSTVGKPISYDILIKEQYSISDISKSISLFSRYIIPLSEDQGLWASYGIAGKHMKLFIDSYFEMSKIINQSNDDKKSDDKKPDEKNEVVGYSRFLLIREKNEFSDQIKEKFDQIFTDDITSLFNITFT